MKARYLYLLALCVVALDQLTKHLAASRIPFGVSKPVIDNVFHITLVENPGGAFGLLQSWAGLFIIIALAVVVAIIMAVCRRSAISKILGISLGLQLGGAVGNLIDRVRFGYVVDFLDFRVWPVFNVADVAITGGIILLAYYLFFCEGRQPEGQLEADP